MIDSFFMASTPHIHFGVGKRHILPGISMQYGKKILLVTGASSFDSSEYCQEILFSLQADCDVRRIKVENEPSPALVDAAVSNHHAFSPACVIAIGGGSTVDAAKAIAGLLPSGDSVMEYLEGVGRGKTYTGPSTPFIALPTTAGTGGETSKNAVLSEVAEDGYKKSFRHEDLVPKHIILDPELTLNCPAAVTAACGMDAFTQLLESFVSRNANPMTDALALSGLQHIRKGLLNAVQHGENIEARASMLYASSISGVTLANAGLGSVHGLASPLGAYFPIPHGVVCGSLLYEATRTNINAMMQREQDNTALKKYAQIGRLMTSQVGLDDQTALQALLDLLKSWSDTLKMPRLSPYGVTASDIPKIIANISGGSMAGNPITLTPKEIEKLIQSRL
ncbi:iron-containing alcohol dehydrogenase [Mariprofundus sp. EBB-1]|uniref:iron-containing alcohol dehydrogenase n=1 Tax=Mariprofundus sp. EBB-1 TaxID=2650971 RepID=UPI000EF1A566|nr:iron-containing alcohol dehydrogenase [Mariprofundus sp. EBB-1]